MDKENSLAEAKSKQNKDTQVTKSTNEGDSKKSWYNSLNNYFGLNKENSLDEAKSKQIKDTQVPNSTNEGDS